MKKITRIDIVGLGALGTMYADFFTRKLGSENVRILADEKRVDRYKKEKIFFNGEECHFNLRNAETETEKSQLLVFCVKYGALPSAMDEVAHLVDDSTVIMAVLNGIRSEEDLGARFGKDKIIYCTAQKMAAVKEGNTARCPDPGDWALGISADGKEENLRAVTAMLDSVGFRYTLPEDIRKALWSKLICNVGVNQTVTLFEGTYKCVQTEGEARDMMRNAMRECAAVAQKEGVDLSEKDVEYWMDVIDHLAPDGEPSMRQDAKAGRKTEVALFAGTICALGKKHGVATPVNDAFLEKIV